RAVGNEDFLDDNDDIRRLLGVVSIPLEDIAAQNAKMAEAELGYSEAQINADAAAWIEANRDTVDRWLATARG
ncbi:MAG: proline/glycine betaine ABC transporter substrate-binding protein ProX, partial [bacterium]|nr:proline/glycine betaine ABC transporter substrate-binding protein ProX [bacterium]